MKAKLIIIMCFSVASIFLFFQGSLHADEDTNLIDKCEIAFVGKLMSKVDVFVTPDKKMHFEDDFNPLEHSTVLPGVILTFVIKKMIKGEAEEVMQILQSRRNAMSIKVNETHHVYLASENYFGFRRHITADSIASEQKALKKQTVPELTKEEYAELIRPLKKSKVIVVGTIKSIKVVDHKVLMQDITFDVKMHQIELVPKKLEKGKVDISKTVYVIQDKDTKVHFIIGSEIAVGLLTRDHLQIRNKNTFFYEQHVVLDESPSVQDEKKEQKKK